MKNFDHIMIDLETFDSLPTAAISSIGALAFDPYADWMTGDVPDNVPVFYKNVDVNSCIKANMSVDGDTIQWWMEQSDDARKALYNPAPEKLPSVMWAFSKWVWDQREQIGTDPKTNRPKYKQYYIWSHGATFDLPIMTYAYKQVNKIQPWQFRNSRDTRTLFDIAFNGKKPTYKGEGTTHNALDDAFTQVMWVQEAYKKIGLQRMKDAA